MEVVDLTQKKQATSRSEMKSTRATNTADQNSYPAVTSSSYQNRQVSTRREMKATGTTAAVAAVAPSSSSASVSVGAASLPSNSITSSDSTMQAIIDQEASRGGNSQEEFVNQQRAMLSLSSIAYFASRDDGGGKLPATSSTVNVSTTLFTVFVCTFYQTLTILFLFLQNDGNSYKSDCMLDDSEDDTVDDRKQSATESKNPGGDRDLGVFEGIVAPFDNSEHYDLVKGLIQPRQQRLGDFSKNNHIHGLMDAVGSDGLLQLDGTLTPSFAKLIDCISPDFLQMLKNDFHCENITKEMMSNLKETEGFDPETQVGGYIRAFIVSLGELRNISQQQKEKYPRAWRVIEKQLKRHRGEPDDTVISMPYVGETSSQTISQRMRQENNPEIRDGAITNWEYGQILDREPLFAQVSLSQPGNKDLSWGLESCVAELMEASSNIASRSAGNIRMSTVQGYGLNAVNCGRPYFISGLHSKMVLKYLSSKRWDLDGVSLISDSRVDPQVKSYVNENSEAILEHNGLTNLEDVQANHVLSMMGANGFKARAEKKQNSMPAGTTYEQAVSQIGKDMLKGSIQKMQNSMPAGTTYEQAASQRGKDAMKERVKKRQARMGPGASYDEAKSQLADEAGAGYTRKMDKKYNRRPEDKKKLQCYKCLRERGDETFKKLPLHPTETHTIGPLLGFPRVNQANGTARCKQCKSHSETKSGGGNVKLWIEPHRIREVTNSCSVPTCIFGRFKESNGAVHEKCQKHHKEENGWKYGK